MFENSIESLYSSTYNIMLQVMKILMVDLWLVTEQKHNNIMLFLILIIMIVLKE